MGSFARIASGVPKLSLANTDTTKAKQSFSSVVQTLTSNLRSNTHLIVQVGLFIGIVAALSAHVAAGSSTNQRIVAAQGGINAPVLDELSAAEVAAVVSITADTMVSEEVVAMAEQVDAGESVAASSEDYVSKPAVAVTDDPSAQGIKTHTVASGESLASIAKQYGVSKDTIKWANNLDDDIGKGDKLKIPPVSGVLYTVKDGDTAKTIASKYNSSAERIVNFNDAELSGLKAGQKIVIPDGKKPAPSTPSTSFASNNTQTTNSRVQTAAAQVSVDIPKSGSPNNSYYFGYCTWGVANLIGVPPFWGNANRWDDSARAAGIAVNGTPKVGSIAQTDAGYGGHVGLVIAVKGNQVKTRDMNGNAGFGVYGDAWHPTSQYQYIHL